MSIHTLSTTAKRGKFEKVKEGLNGRVRKQKRSPHKRLKEMKTNAPKKLHNARLGGAKASSRAFQVVMKVYL
jgi:hypothetical protein